MSDPRFARLKTDPRFRKPKKRQNRVVVDERFKSVLKQEKKKDKAAKGLVDKYGRPVSSTQEEDNLKRFYRLEGEEEEAPRRPDYARGEVVMESSDEEEDEEQGGDDDSDTGGIVRLGFDPENQDEELDVDLDEDDDNLALLDAQAAAYSKANEGREEEVEDANRTRRFAVVNLDWDHVRASHLYKIFSSLVSPSAPIPSSAPPKKNPGSAERSMKEAPQLNIVRGKVVSVQVYPSDFGKERMEREEKEGPPADIFKKKRNFDELDAKSLYELGGEDEVDDNALRKYQLERLRYYYAIVTCDTVETASHLYNELQGTELERSANVFDLSFVPDDMTFDNEPRDEATEVGEISTKGIDFVTPALRHSKVTLTWDEDDPERGQVTRRTLTRQEIDDGDFRAYIASSSGSESESEGLKKKEKKGKKVNRDRLRALLLGGNDDQMPEGWGEEEKGDMDMEITFTPGLLGKENVDDENTLEKYQRKMREKRKKRKEEVKEKSVDKGKEKEKEVADDFFEADSEEETSKGDRHGSSKKGNHKKQPVEESTRAQEATAEELELLVASNNPDAEQKHFDFKAVLKAEKNGKKRRKGKKDKKETRGDDELQEDFTINVQDERFKVLHEDHQFAIDPSNPHFKKTKGMSALLEERRKRLHKRNDRQAPESTTRVTAEEPSNRSLEKLVESVKRKSIAPNVEGQGKRRKL